MSIYFCWENLFEFDKGDLKEMCCCDREVGGWGEGEGEERRGEKKRRSKNR